MLGHQWDKIFITKFSYSGWIQSSIVCKNPLTLKLKRRDERYHIREDADYFWCLVGCFEIRPEMWPFGPMYFSQKGDWKKIK